jgi:hypothetical protein
MAFIGGTNSICIYFINLNLNILKIRGVVEKKGGDLLFPKKY